MSEILYLDHAGATLTDPLQLQEYYEFLTRTTLANPHSHGFLGDSLSNLIDESRQLVLEHFGADPNEYSVIFTSGATSAIKLVGECFPWSSTSILVYPYNSHTSILGLREYSPSTFCIPSENILSMPSFVGTKDFLSSNECGYSLLAIPGESNFSGTKYPPAMISHLLHNLSENNLHSLCSQPLKSSPGSSTEPQKWLWLLDASKLASTNAINLTQDYSNDHRPDFICCSFYKIFGFPTGIGALLMKKSIAPLLKKRYFGGGSVASVVADKDWSISASLIHTRFEDGTLNYHGITALKYGFRALTRVGGMSAIQFHTFQLCQYLYQQMITLTHENNSLQLCTIYGHHHLQDMSRQGSIITFNLKWSNGNWIGFNEVERLAVENKIQLRTGCFCCIGGCQEALFLTGDQVKENMKHGRSCHDTSADLIDNSPTGAVRVSVGYMTTIQDCKRFLQFLIDNFLNTSPDSIIVNENQEKHLTAVITAMYIYPIKSCAGVRVSRWPLTSSGFYLDRRYALRSTITGKTLTLKSHPKLALCTPYISLESNWMIVVTSTMSTILGINCVTHRSLTIPHDQLLNSHENHLNLELLYETFLSHVNQLTPPANCDERSGKDERDEKDEGDEREVDSIQICLDCTEAFRISLIADLWFSEYLETSCNLVCQNLEIMTTTGDEMKKTRALEKSFVNSGQFLLVSKQSIENLEDKLVTPTPYQATSDSSNSFSTSSTTGSTEENETIKVTEKKFRPNLVVSCPTSPPHDEDSWKSLTMETMEIFTDGTQFKSSQIIFSITGPCARCAIININPENGKKEPQTFKTLASYRKDQKSNILFGQYLSYQADYQQILNSHYSDKSWIVINENSSCQIERRERERDKK